MRSFSCYYYHKIKDNTLEMNINNSCWAGIRYYQKVRGRNYNDIIDNENPIIYIEKYEEEEQKEHVDLLLSIINRITPCKITVIDDKKYIEYHLIEGYDNNLILLNFIRNLWNEPYHNYSTYFFKYLKSSRYKYPLAKLTDANIKACKQVEVDGNKIFRYGPGHSNVNQPDKMVIKNTKDLIGVKFNCTTTFLTT